MDAKLALGSLFLHLLIILPADCKGDVETRIEQVHASPHMHHTGDVETRIEQVHSSPHMHHTDPSLIVFFMEDDLKEGNTVPIYFPKRKLDSSAHLLPKEEADSIPFSSHHLHHLLSLFSFPHGSPQATAMEDTLRQCETTPIKGETKTCATSWESMLDFTRTILGSDSDIQILSTTQIDTQSNELIHMYKVTGIHQIKAPKMVACHTMPYPYAVFYCHYQESESKVFRVLLEVDGEINGKVEAIAVCHMDTSQWSRNHVAFKVLGIEPGSSPVCHFFPADNFVCVSSKP